MLLISLNKLDFLMAFLVAPLGLILERDVIFSDSLGVRRRDRVHAAELHKV